MTGFFFSYLRDFVDLRKGCDNTSSVVDETDDSSVVVVFGFVVDVK